VSEYAFLDECKDQKEWKTLSLWLDMSLTGIAGGLFIGSILTEYGLGLIIAFVVMVLAKVVLLVADLGKPARFLIVLRRPGKSWISRGAWGILLFGVTGIVVIAPLLIPALPWSPWTGIGQYLGWLTALLAAFLMLYDGISLAECKAVEFWRSGELPILLLLSGATGGLGALTLLNGPGFYGVLSLAHLIVTVLTGLLLLRYLANAKKDGVGARRSRERLSEPSLRWVFWGATIVAGLILPAIMAAVSMSAVSMAPGVLVAAGILEIVGAFSLRYSILNAGVYSPIT
jgi:formate-dependent nitrite reductase membrane component NrfD